MLTSSLVKYIASGNKVDLKNADKIVIVEVLKVRLLIFLSVPAFFEDASLLRESHVLASMKRRTSLVVSTFDCCHLHRRLPQGGLLPRKAIATITMRRFLKRKKKVKRKVESSDQGRKTPGNQERTARPKRKSRRPRASPPKKRRRHK